MGLRNKHLLGIAELTVKEINQILDTAQSFKQVATRPIKKVPTLRGKTVINLFFEASTRTRASFELAEKRLSADTLNFAVSTSSVTKGESLVDTAKNLESMSPSIIVIRHGSSGAPHILADICKASVVNAGDGMHEHPTQALLDAFTVRTRKGSIAGLKVAIIGDLAHSRVARSGALIFSKLGANVIACGPPTLIPPDFARLGAAVSYHIDEAVSNADVVMMLRVQRERQQEAFFPSQREYFDLYGLTRARMRLAKPDAIVMHPGPMNRGVEIASEVADGPDSVILEQVSNGIAVRMSVLYLVAAAHASEDISQ
ncbi:MAG: aspartate carbamoyltransferase catalytic subunit [Acidobacteria bacterium]|nr:aspartate carbamoyltransferase catalytic subunit [Acidobacteriota bacterium]MBI3656014.1 aspartate carbamoyltransferase catalytic subunit [Acidobacteriota bacterium]